MFFPAGSRYYGWICLSDLLRQMGWMEDRTKSTSRGESLEQEFINPVNEENLRKPAWVAPGRSEANGGAIIVDVWDVLVSWVRVAIAITENFYRNQHHRVDIKPLRYPPNRALFTTCSKEETDLVLKASSVRIGNDILCFQAWQPKITKLVSAVMEGNKWI